MKRKKTNEQHKEYVEEKQKIILGVDVIIFSFREKELQVLLIQRKYPPFEEEWAIPGGFVKNSESAEMAAIRELEEESGVSDVYMEQLYTFSSVNRDPRGRVVSVAYMALLPGDSDVQLNAGTDAADAKWFSVEALPNLAFDHSKILGYARERLINKLEYTTAGFRLLPMKFTLSELQMVYEKVLGKSLDKRNFRRKLELLDILKPTEESRMEGATRPALLFTLSEKKFEKLKNKGILFPF